MAMWKFGYTLTLASIVLVSVMLCTERGIYTVSTSPQHQRYRVEYHRPSPLQSMIHFKDQDPGFVRLYDNWANSLLGESAVVDFNDNGRIDWDMDCCGEVQVGRDVVFQNIPRERTPCPQCDPK